MAKFIDGTEVPDEYLHQIHTLIEEASMAEEIIPIDELEEYAKEKNNGNIN